MTLRLDHLLNQCTVRIKVPGSKGYGTGFFFSPGYVLTCAHVIQEQKGVWLEVIPNGTDRSIRSKVRYLASNDIDIAILELDPKEKVNQRFPCALLGTVVEPGDSCYTYGYTDSEGGFPEGDPVTLECEGLTGGKSSYIKLKGGQVRPGLSGSPLLNKNTGRVCGIVKFTRDRGFDLGGGAIPITTVFSALPILRKVNKNYHLKDSQWFSLLSIDVEAFDSDWTYLDDEAKKKQNRWRIFLFLLKVAFKWLILGQKAPRAFPMKTVRLLMEHTFQGDLGQELKRQRKEFTRKLTFEIDPNGCDQAELLYRLDSQAKVVSQLIDMLFNEEQDMASRLRLLWVTEIIHEQRDLIDKIKKNEGNSYPQLETFKKKFFLFRDSEDERYIDIDRAIGRLANKYTNPDLIIKSFLDSFLDTFIGEIKNTPKISFLYVDKALDFFILKVKKIVPMKKDDLNTASIHMVIEDLNAEIKKYPDLQVLRKIKSLLESVSTEMVQGGLFRAWNEAGVYHFNKRCTQYPERASAEAMKKILCYDTRQEAGKKHKPCQRCMKFESSLRKS